MLVAAFPFWQDVRSERLLTQFYFFSERMYVTRSVI